ncbi:hypothetical protein ACIQJ4_04415 [Streptomyces filamentosus]|uniref:hypothetical protein n=1 Tax=Streptomyces filamentosus TaxID=67294 RepID=UPI0038203B0E
MATVTAMAAVTAMATVTAMAAMTTVTAVTAMAAMAAVTAGSGPGRVTRPGWGGAGRGRVVHSFVRGPSGAGGGCLR